MKKSEIQNPKSKIQRLGYGRTFFEFEFDPNRFDVLGGVEDQRPLSDAEIGRRFDSPIDSKTVEEIVRPGESVLLVVPDATRRTASGQIVNLLVRRLIAAGVMPFDIRIIFATGIHRKVTDDEKEELVTPFIAQRIKMLDHNPRDLATVVRLGETSGKIPVELDRSLTEHDHTITVGGINFHYFAGFTGGRKMVCPGLASSRTVGETHRLAFDFEKRRRRAGVGPGLLDDNPVHEAFTEAVEKCPPSFSVNTIVNDRGQAVEVFAGDWRTSHRKACASYAATHTEKIEEKRDLIIVSCGGFPHDINMIQAHKALDAASKASRDGGTIVLLAECENGLGRKDFLDWFETENSAELAEKLCQSYQVNGQTAWAILQKAEKFDVRIVTDLPEDVCGRMRLKKASGLKDALSGIDPQQTGYILPFGAKFLIT
ncbi:MAG: nickel-dependent lactate racemase [Pyrinomonadaceae bacterium]